MKTAWRHARGFAFPLPPSALRLCSPPLLPAFAPRPPPYLYLIFSARWSSWMAALIWPVALGCLVALIRPSALFENLLGLPQLAVRGGLGLMLLAGLGGLVGLVGPVVRSAVAGGLAWLGLLVLIGQVLDGFVDFAGGLGPMPVVVVVRFGQEPVGGPEFLDELAPLPLVLPLCGGRALRPGRSGASQADQQRHRTNSAGPVRTHDSVSVSG